MLLYDCIEDYVKDIEVSCRIIKGECKEVREIQSLREENKEIAENEWHKDFLSAMLKKHGGNQRIVLVEEMAELMEEICKEIQRKGNYEHIAEEIADVYIMLAQMIRFYDISDEVDKWLDYKVKRQIAREIKT